MPYDSAQQPGDSDPGPPRRESEPFQSMSAKWSEADLTASLHVVRFVKKRTLQLRRQLARLAS